jgi:glycerophosphoryl diester phosphodiesterase
MSSAPLLVPLGYARIVHPYFDTPRPHLIAHRGASAEHPENTLPAFERAWQAGTPFLETDCHATADGEIVLIHDATLDRTTDGTGPVRERSWAEIAGLDAGYRFSPGDDRAPYRGRGIHVPQLAELLAALPDARVNLEIKQADPPIAERVLQVIREARAEDRVLLTAEDATLLDAVRALGPRTAIGSSVEDVLDFFRALHEGRIASFRPAGQVLQIPVEAFGERLVTPSTIDAAHRVGLFVHVWTVNDPGAMRELLALGVDGLMSDDPARLVAVARER